MALYLYPLAEIVTMLMNEWAIQIASAAPSVIEIYLTTTHKKNNRLNVQVQLKLHLKLVKPV